MKPHFFLDQSGSFLETKYITRSTMSKEKYYYRVSKADNPMWGPARFARNAPTPRAQTGKARFSLIGFVNGASPPQSASRPLARIRSLGRFARNAPTPPVRTGRARSSLHRQSRWSLPPQSASRPLARIRSLGRFAPFRLGLYVISHSTRILSNDYRHKISPDGREQLPDNQRGAPGKTAAEGKEGDFISSFDSTIGNSVV